MNYQYRDRRYKRPSIWLVLSLFVALGAVVTTSVQTRMANADAGSAAKKAAVASLVEEG